MHRAKKITEPCLWINFPYVLVLRINLSCRLLALSFSTQLLHFPLFVDLVRVVSVTWQFWSLTAFSFRQGLICNSGRWWNCTADFSPNKIPPNVVELSGTAFRLVLTRVYGKTFSGPLPAIHLSVGAEKKVVAAFNKLIVLPSVHHVYQ